MRTVADLRTAVLLTSCIGLLQPAVQGALGADEGSAPAPRVMKIQAVESLAIEHVRMTGRLGQRHLGNGPYLEYLHDQAHPWRDVPQDKERAKRWKKDERIGRDFMLEQFTKRSLERTRGFEGEYAGKWIDAASLMVANTADQGLAKKLESFVEVLRKAQDQDGYLGIEPPERRGSEWDMWNQWYALWGLLSHYEYRGNRQSLETASRLGAYILANYSPPNAKMDLFKGAWAGGCTVDVIDQLVRLYRHTGNDGYLKLAGYASANFGPIEEMRARQVPVLSHAYVLCAYLGGLVTLNQVTGNQGELAWLEKVWEGLDRNHLFPTGSMGLRERITDKPLADLEGQHLQETCATVEWLLYSHRLYEATGRIRYLNAIEDTVYNALLAAQSPDGAKWAYYTPLSSTRKGKEFFVGPTMCCFWSGPRGIARMPLYLFHLDADGLRVEFYESASAQFTWQGSTVTVHQRSDYPSSGNVDLRLDADRPIKLALKLRLPDWAANVRASINGEPVGQPLKAGQFAELKRTWKNNDRLALAMDMAVTLKALPAGTVCIKRGPEILSADARDNPGLDLNTIALAAADIPELTTLPAGKNGRRRYACPMNVNGAPRAIVLTPYADAGNDRAGYRSSFPTR